jgi:hypothetical protein
VCRQPVDAIRSVPTPYMHYTVQMGRRSGGPQTGGPSVSIVRVGLQETKGFAEGYEAIFGKKKAGAAKKPAARKPAAKAKKPAARKAGKKK